MKCSQHKYLRLFNGERRANMFTITQPAAIQILCDPTYITSITGTTCNWTIPTGRGTWWTHWWYHRQGQSTLQMTYAVASSTIWLRGAKKWVEKKITRNVILLFTLLLIFSYFSYETDASWLVSSQDPHTSETENLETEIKFVFLRPLTGGVWSKSHHR